MRRGQFPREALWCALILAGIWGVWTVALAGDLESGGPPPPPMKILRQVEPRTPIGQADIPKTIRFPGSYYLTENLIVVGIRGTHVIDIASPDVTLHLKGFTITGSSEVSQADDGVAVSFECAVNVVVKNGVIRDCLDDGVSASLIANSQMLNFRVFRNGGHGIVVGEGAVVSHCTARNNGDGGISAGAGSTVSNCAALSNLGTGNFEAGIFAVSGSIVTACTTRGNSNDGMFVLSGSTVTDCTASDNAGNFGSTGNTITGCTAYSNDEDGIVSGNGSTVSGCTAYFNTLDGISANNSLVRGNTAVSNTTNINVLGGSILMENHTAP